MFGWRYGVALLFCFFLLWWWDGASLLGAVALAWLLIVVTWWLSRLLLGRGRLWMRVAQLALIPASAILGGGAGSWLHTRWLLDHLDEYQPIADRLLAKLDRETAERVEESAPHPTLVFALAVHVRPDGRHSVTMRTRTGRLAIRRLIEYFPAGSPEHTIGERYTPLRGGWYETTGP